MTYVASASDNSKGIGGKKGYVSNEGAVAENLRLGYIKQQRERLERERTKIDLERKKRIFDGNKILIAHREIELRRLQSEDTRAESEVNTTTRDNEDWQQKINHKKVEIHAQGEQIQKLLLELQQLKNKQEKAIIEVTHMESELKYKNTEKDKKQDMKNQMDKRKEREINEIDRLNKENIILQEEIRRLELKAK